MNDATFSWNNVKVPSLKDCTFVSELLKVIKRIYGFAVGSAFIKYKI
ncbi:MAG TPA: hypothetical protein VLR54_00805 [Methanobacteriaceae archaeon]|nr:hypothetical protein [Methanobacteriaceae archaeon]